MTDRRTKVERRTFTPRRRRRDRQRNTNERFAVVEIAGKTLRAVILDRSPEKTRDQVSVVSLQWRNEDLSLNSGIELEELSTALRELSDKHGLQGAQLQFLLSGKFCVTKAVSGASEEVRTELQQLEQRSQLYLMLGPGEKVIVSRTQAIDARHQYAVAAICNRNTLNTIHQAATNAGLEVDSIEPALIATSRVIARLEDAPSEPCLLIHMDESVVELGVCHNGQILLDYRPGGRTDPQELVELVRTHLGRLQRHVGRRLREASPSLRHIYLCGEDCVVEKAVSLFSGCGQFETHRITPNSIQATWDFERGSSESATAPALGALLSSYLPSSERNAPNLMEHILASSRTPLKPVLLRSIIPLAALLLIAVSIFLTNFHEKRVIDRLMNQVESLAVSRAQATNLQLQIASNETKLSQLKLLAAELQAKSLGNLVVRIGQCMPSDVWLNKLVIDDMQTIQLTGTGFLEEGIFDFVRWLSQAPGFKDVALRGTKPGQSPSGPAVNFEVELNLADSAGPVSEVARNE